MKRKFIFTMITVMVVSTIFVACQSKEKNVNRIEQTTVEEKTEKEESEGVADSKYVFAGKYIDDEENDISIVAKESGEYEIVIGLIRLASLEGTAKQVGLNLEMELVDPSGEPMKAVWYIEEDGTCTLKITESTWEYITTGTEYKGFKNNGEA